MAPISVEARKIAREYIENLGSRLKIKKAILFGSAARGKMTRDSDIDLIIISDEFRDMNLRQRLVFLSRSRGNKFIDWPMDVLGYTTDEFNKLSRVSSMFSEARKYGLVIK